MPVSIRAASDAEGKFSISIPEDERRVTMSVSGYRLQSLTYGTTNLLQDPLRFSSSDTAAELRVILAPPFSSVFPVVGAVPLVGGSAVVVSPGVPPSPLPTLPASSLNRVTEAVAQENLISSPPLYYPPLARTARVQSTVLLQFEVNVQGRVQNIAVVSGHSLLNAAVIEAVRQRVYTPFVLNGQTVPVVTTATVTFRLE